MTIQSVDPRTGQLFGPNFPSTSASESDLMIARAETAYRVWSQTSAQSRARILDALADALDAHSEELAILADSETALGLPRLTSEVGRMTFQIRTFARALEAGTSASKLDEAVDAPLPQGHPKFLRSQRGIGVVAIYGASNFPFAFSVMGGDTASAIAAGCSVVVKAHPAHPQTSQRTFEIAEAALSAAGAPKGLVNLGHGFEFGSALIRDSRIGAGAFTGSRAGGRALFDIAQSRPNPIPFYGELGSVNPVVATQSAISDPEKFVVAYLDSLLMGGGQFCTNPSLLFVPENSELIFQMGVQLPLRAPHPFLSDATKKLHDANRIVLRNSLKGRSIVGNDVPEIGFYSPFEVIVVKASEIFDEDILAVECFGPTGIVITYSEIDEVIAILTNLEGALVGSLFADIKDTLVPELVEALANITGRVTWNAWPTGVSVTSGQHHGGPYPASTSPLHTSVGVTSISRFLRPIAFQNFPDELTQTH